LLPAVKGLQAEVHLTDDLAHRRALLGLLQGEGNLLAGKAGPFHGDAILAGFFIFVPFTPEIAECFFAQAGKPVPPGSLQLVELSGLAKFSHHDWSGFPGADQTQDPPLKIF
jgi:hypothetical protein